MKGRVCLITGANSGIGKATALELAGMGATLVIVARDKQKGENAMSEIRSDTGNNSIELLLADLSSLQSVRELAQRFQAKYSKLHVLINNAGLFNQRRNVTPDAYEGTVATNICSRPMGPLGFIMAVPKLFMTSPNKGAETVVYLASSPDATSTSGEYWDTLKVKKSSEESYNEEVARRLWEVSEKLTSSESKGEI